MTIANVGEFETGLEDFGVEDAVIPRLQIVHKEAVFKDSLSGETFDTVRVIILGLVKQRILWSTQLDDGDKPMCRSTNHRIGLPNMSDDQPKDKRFPWAKSGFDPADYPEDESGVIRVPCDGCQLKEWGSHPDGKRPFCSEQFTLPVLYDPYNEDNFVPAIMTFQKTGLKPLKSYLTSFARSRNAAFTAITEIGLTAQQRGQTDYAVPNFKKVGNTEDTEWRDYSINYRTMKDFLEAEPGSRDEGEDGGVGPVSENVAKPPASKPAPKAEPADVEEEIVDAEVVEEPAAKPAAKAAPTPAPAAEADDDDLPF